LLGIDIVEISRIEKLISKEGDRFLNRILSAQEIEIALRRKKIAEFASGRFAVKEAYVKATGDKKTPFNEICILNEENGKPYIKGRHDIEISISHEKKFAVGVVLVKLN